MGKADKRARKRENQQKARQEREAAAKKAKQRKQFMYIGGGLAVVVIIIAIAAATGGDDKKKVTTTTTTVAGATTTAAPQATTTTAPGATTTTEALVINAAKQYTAAIETNFGTIKIALDPKAAPKATNHFVKLAKAGFYDGLTWHRVVKDFVIQGGDPKGDGTGGADTTIIGEVPTDNYPEGSLAAAKGGNDPAGTFSSQFFITVGSQGATLSNDYARWGKVTEGLDVAKQIEALAPNDQAGGAPTKEAKIVKITVTES